MSLFSSKKRPWTFMVYMAGDNGRVFTTTQGPIKLMAEMTTAGYKDLEEMAAVGTTENVAVVCLFDSLDGSFQIEVKQGGGFHDSDVQRVSEVNMGDPVVLRDFIVRAMTDYPAERNMLVIWNHGSGWLDVDHYAVVRTDGDNGLTHAPIFRRTPRRATDGETTRPIAYDDSSMDFLDSQDLHAALAEAQAKTGRRLDVIGMDACLMAMIEGARELAPHADYFVASQEVEPMSGWPYHTILRALDDEPDMAPAHLAQTVVRLYAEYFDGLTRAEQTVTQSAINLARSSTTAALCQALASSILDADDPGIRPAIRAARKDALVFENRNYRDLGDFAAAIVRRTEFAGLPQVTAAASALQSHLAERGRDAVVLETGFVPAYDRASGLSVYLPMQLTVNPPERALTSYARLSFAQTARWAELLAWLCSDW